MSNYTTELRYIIEECNGLKKSSEYAQVNILIQNAIPKIFEKFPIFDESYRNALCTKILKHYYFYEIGTSTKGRFLFELNETMNRIMPYYNKLYLAWLEEFNPLYSTDLTTEHHQKGEDTENNISIESGKNKNTSNTLENNSLNSETENNVSRETLNVENGEQNEKLKRKFSDTPQGALTNLENDTYMSEAEINENKRQNESISNGSDSSRTKDNSKTESTTNNLTTNENINNVNKNDNKMHNNSMEYVTHVFGFSNSPSKNLQDFYNALLNIDELVIKDLSSCFMQIF